MCFYGLTMVASDIGDNLFLNFILVLGIELPAILFATYGLDRFGRKPLLAYSQILAGVTLIAAGLLMDYDPLIPVSFVWFSICFFLLCYHSLLFNFLKNRLFDKCISKTR